MIIGVDAGSLGVRDERLKVGVYQVTLNLLRQLGRIDKKNHYWLYSFLPIEKEILNQFGPKMGNVVARPSFGWRHFGLPLSLFLKKPDVFLGPSQALPIFSFSPSVVLVYDLAFEHFPECYLNHGKRLKKITHSAVSKAQRIIAISQVTKKDLIKVYQVPRRKVSVIHGGYNPIFKPQSKAEIKRIKEKYDLKKPYFLFVGSLKPIKNVPRIIEGFYKFLKKTKKSYQLVLVGSDFWLDKKISKKIKQLRLRKSVVNLGYLPRKDLPGIYSGAKAFVSPSLYEGFGLPLLEAMACGTPVITSKAGSIPEIVGNTALLVNPHDSNDIAQSMEHIVYHTAEYDMLRKQGLKRAKMFSWKKFATKVLSLLEKFE